MNRTKQRAFSLVELLSIVAIIGILAALVVIRVQPSSSETRARACNARRGNIEIQIRLYHRNEGAWPTTTLADIGGDTGYFPEGLPVCPVDGSAYEMDPTTHRVLGHNH